MHTFWTKPMFSPTKDTGWATLEDNLVGHLLSFHKGRQHFEATELVTDQWGKEILIDRLGCSYDSIQLIPDAFAMPH